LNRGNRHCLCGSRIERVECAPRGMAK